MNEATLRLVFVGIQLQLTNTLTGQPGIQITGIDPAMLTQPLPLQIDNNLLAQLQQGGNLNITFNASGAVTGAQAVPAISAEPQFIQVNVYFMTGKVNWDPY